MEPVLTKVPPSLTLPRQGEGSQVWKSQLRTSDVTDLLCNDACVVFALRREAAPFCRHFRPQQRFAAAPCWAWSCGTPGLNVLVLETGPGRQRTEAAMRWLLGRVPYPPKMIVSAGFSGALQEEYRIGDVILATEVVDAAGNAWPATWPGQVLDRTGPPWLKQGRLLSVAGLVSSPAEKRTLGIQHGVAAVDMETAVIARCCTEHGIPFGCVRTISDCLDTPLSPKLMGCLSGGRVSPRRLLAALVSSPRLAVELWRLARHSRLAAERLGQALGQLLQRGA